MRLVFDPLQKKRERHACKRFGIKQGKNKKSVKMCKCVYWRAKMVKMVKDGIPSKRKTTGDIL